MEKRFTSKDIVLMFIVTVVALLVLLSMYQIDRQWSKLNQMERLLSEQSQEMRTLRATTQTIDRRLRDGITLSNQGSEFQDDIPPGLMRAFEAASAENYAVGDSLILPLQAGINTLSAIISTDSDSSTIQAYVLESLATINPDTLEWQGLIARDWVVSEDGLTITFNLREDVTFSDGEQLTADDVEFTYDFIFNDRIAAPHYRAYLEKIQSVTALSDYVVEFRFEEPYFNSMSLAAGFQVLARHFYEPYLENPEQYNESRGLLFGTGPYRLANPREWTPDQGGVELERNPRYWAPIQSPFDSVVWRVIANSAARLTTFRNGEIDVYGAQPREYQQLLEDEELSQRTQNFEYLSPRASYSYIGWNQLRDGEPTRFADRRVRQAMSHLTDVEGIIEEIFLGYAEPAISPFNPSTPQHDPSLETYAYDPTQAAELLRQAGYEDRNGDGILEDEAGEPFRFSFLHFQDSEIGQRIALYLRDSYARVGIDMQPLPAEWPVMQDLVDRGEVDAVFMAWGGGDVERDLYQVFHSSSAVPGGSNWNSYKSSEFDLVIEQARREMNEEVRLPLWREAERILYEDQPYTFMTRSMSLAFVDRRFENIEVTNFGINMLFVPVEIYVPGPMQKYSR